MTAAELSELHSAMRRYGIPGVPAPVDPMDPEGPWRVFDCADPRFRRDITPQIRARVDAVRQRPAARGFVVAAR